MFTKYFGLFLIAGGIVASFISLFFTGLYVDRFTGAIKIDDKELSFGIFLFVAIILVTFFIGKYLYKIGKIKKTPANIEGNKLVKIAVTLYVASIVIIPMAYLAARINCGNRLNNYVCNSSVISLGSSLEFVFLGIFPAIIMSGVAIILLIIHWLKNRGLK